MWNQFGNRLVTLCFVFVLGCDSTDKDARSVYEVEVAGEETFRIALTTDEQIATADSVMQSDRVGAILGDLRRGDGGFNTGYSWHLDPESVEFPDMAIELCDGLPSFVESDLDYWVDTVRTYCPWSARVLRRVDG